MFQTKLPLLQNPASPLHLYWVHHSKPFLFYRITSPPTGYTASLVATRSMAICWSTNARGPCFNSPALMHSECMYVNSLIFYSKWVLLLLLFLILLLISLSIYLSIYQLNQLLIQPSILPPPHQSALKTRGIVVSSANKQHTLLILQLIG